MNITRARSGTGACRLVVATVLAALWLPAALADYASDASASAELMPRNLQFARLRAEDGLSQEMISQIVQDAQGFVWIGTQEGLNRFDGYQIDVYEHLKADSSTLSHDLIRQLMVDRQGRLWVGTEAGVNLYQPETDSFEREPFKRRGLNVPGSSPIRAMLQTRDQAYWLGTAGEGLIRIHLDEQRTQRFLPDRKHTDSLPSDTVLALLEDSKGNLWVGAEAGGLTRFDPVTGRFVRFGASAPATRALERASVRTIFEDRAGFIWVGTAESGLFRLDPRKLLIDRFQHDHDALNSLPDDRVRDIVEDEQGTLWVATDSGLAEWRAAERGFETYRHISDDPQSLADDRVNTLMVDDSGVLWVGTWDGVSRWNYFSDTFDYYRQDNGLLPGDLVTAMAESRDGVIWAGTYGTGLAAVDQAAGRAEFYRHDPNDPRSLPDDRVMSVLVDDRNRVWVGTRANGLARLDTASGHFERFRHDPGDPGSLSADAVTSLHLNERDGVLWVGTFGGGLNRLTLQGDGVFERFLHDPKDPASLSGDRVLTIFEDSNGSLWVGTDTNGLNRFDAGSGSFERIAFESQLPAASKSGQAAAWSPLEAGTVAELIEDRHGDLWVGTVGQGLLRWSSDDRSAGTARVRVYGKGRGLPTDTIYGVLEDQRGALWISSNRGLTRLQPDAGVFRQFDSRNGLRDNEFNQGARLRSRSGRLYFGGTHGIVGFYPGELPFNERPPNVVVTARSRQQTLTRASAGGRVPELEVGYLDRFLAFDFVALDFMSPDKNQYRYQLQGFDPGWIAADDFRRTSYTNLPPGEYRFVVQASNNDGVWNESGAAVDVVVVPAPWNTWWAYLGYGLAGLLGLALLWRSQQLKLRREARHREELEGLVQERTQELEQRNGELLSLNEKLAEASVTDSLTGLRNRRYVDQFISSEVSLFERSMAEDGNGSAAGSHPKDKRRHSRIMFFMMIDLDGFKQINDLFGHHAGDLVLMQVKDVLQRCSRASDTLIRWGGDEFMVIGFSSGLRGVQVLSQRIRRAIAEQIYDVGNGQHGRLSASIGVAPYPLLDNRRQFCSWELVAAVADQAAYIAKANGRDAWVSLSGSDSFDTEDLSRLTTDLPELIGSGKVILDSSIRGEIRLPGEEAGLTQRLGVG